MSNERNTSQKSICSIAPLIYVKYMKLRIDCLETKITYDKTNEYKSEGNFVSNIKQ